MKCSGHLWQHGLPCATPGCERGVDSSYYVVVDDPPIAVVVVPGTTTSSPAVMRHVFERRWTRGEWTWVEKWKEPEPI